MNEKLFDKFARDHADKRINEVLRLAELGLWAEQYGIPALRKHEEYGAPVYYEKALAALPKDVARG